MNSEIPRPSTSKGWSWTNLLRDLVATWRLLLDPSVPGLLRLVLPLLALLYWVWPLDLIPLLPIDDIAVFVLAARLLVALSPRESVDRAFNGRSAPAAHPDHPAGARPMDGEVIETTWRVVE
jgi:uncharacterized membrane protein YkvA (DUF1232 family)